MAQDNCQKIKLLKLYELLQQETDEQNPMTTATIIARLGQMGISCERRTVTKDMTILNEQGYEVMWRWVGKEKGYYVEDRSFSAPELKILLDAVEAASFIPPKKSAELMAKIADLGGSHRSELLQNNMVCFNTRKHSNERIYYNVNYLEEALHNKKKVIFLYYDLNEHGEKVYRRDGHHYVVEPVALVFNEDNYYLVVYSAMHDNTANYRVDRMEAVEVLKDAISEKAIELRATVSEYTEQAIKMYGGELVDIVLEFDRALIGSVYDRFGEGTRMMASGDDKCLATVKVQLSPTFWGWLFQFGGQMKVLSPEPVIEEYKKRATMIYER